jgi:quinol monooxygenase YgiN
MVVVTFKLHDKPGNQLENRQSLQGISDKVKKLNGCNETKVYQDVDDENIFFMVEEWLQQRHLDDHMKTSLFRALLGIKGLLTKEPEIMFMNEA